MPFETSPTSSGHARAVPETEASRIEEIRAAQLKFFKSGATLTRAFREEQLRALSSAMEKFESKIAAALFEDLGKNAAQTYITEVGLVKADCSRAIKRLAGWMKPRAGLPGIALAPAITHRVPQPLGLNLIIAPWNYPVQLALAPLVGAIAAGNVAVVKPSEVSAASSEVIAELIADTFAPEHIACVTGGVETSTHLLAVRWDHLFFTGGPVVGKIVAHAAAEHFSRLTLELGGKSPTIVTATANLEVAAKRIMFGKCTNAGQTCIAPDYLLVERSVHDELLTRMATAVKGFYGEDPSQASDYGRIINDRHFERIAKLIDADKVFMGGQTDAATRYIAPTILRDVGVDDAVMQSEIFGPILPVIAVDDLDEAIALIERHPNPLALYLFTGERKDEKKVLDRVSFGDGCVNQTLIQFADHNVPFGGIGHSGTGAYHGDASFWTFSHVKGVVRASNMFDMSLRYPPFEKNMGLIRRLIG
ncbi:MAG: aldehyde dehydrogenase family protein [Nannocystaceae bacterium]|nr:aldehyde dehydrogenase family protein [Nannocystaceae bacterium]